MGNGTFAGIGNQYDAPVNLDLNSIGSAGGYGHTGGPGVLNRNINTLIGGVITGTEYGNSKTAGQEGWSYPQNSSTYYKRFFDYCGKTGWHSETLDGTTYNQPDAVWFNGWNTGSRITNSWQTGTASNYGYNSSLGDTSGTGKGMYMYNSANTGWGSNYPIIMMHPMMQENKVGSVTTPANWLNSKRFQLRIKHRLRDSSAGSRGSIRFHRIRWNANGSWSWYYPTYYYDSYGYGYSQCMYHQLGTRAIGYYRSGGNTSFQGNWISGGSATNIIDYYPQWIGIQIDFRPNAWYRLQCYSGDDRSGSGKWQTVDQVSFDDTYKEIDTGVVTTYQANAYISAIGGHSDYTGCTFSFDCATATGSSAFDSVGFWCDAQLARWDGYH